METPRRPADEKDRIEALLRLGILDTPPEERFDRITRLAAQVLETPIALVSLVDKDRQWFKSRVGLEAKETPRNISFCGHAILGNDVFIVPDAGADPRFADNPLVTGDPSVRFYAGAALKTRTGHNIGTLCVIDRRPRELSPEKTRALEDLASLVVTELERNYELASLSSLAGLSRSYQNDNSDSIDYAQFCRDIYNNTRARLVLYSQPDKEAGKCRPRALAGDENWRRAARSISPGPAGLVDTAGLLPRVGNIAGLTWLENSAKNEVFQALFDSAKSPPLPPEGCSACAVSIRDRDGQQAGIFTLIFSGKSATVREYFILSLVDIIQLNIQNKQYLKTIRTDNEVMKSVLEGSPEGVVWFDEDTGDIKYINQKYREIWQMPPELTHPNRRELFEFSLDQAADPGRLKNDILKLHADPGLVEKNRHVKLKSGRVLSRDTQPVGGGSTDKPGRILYYRDITEMERARDELQKYLETLEMVQRRAGLGYWSEDLRRGATTWSSTIYTIFGFEPFSVEPSLGIFNMLTHPDDLEATERARQRKNYRITFRIVLPDSSIRVIHERGDRVEDDRGNPLELRGTTQDITELATATHQLEQIQNLSNTGFWHYNLKTGQIVWTSQTYKIFGLPDDGQEIGMDDYLERVHSADRQLLREKIDRCVNQGKAYSIVHRINRGEDTIWVEGRGRALTDGKGDVIQLEGMVQDITRRKKIENDLKSFINALHRSALVSITDTRGRIVEVNDEFCRVSGYSREELMGQHHRIVNSGLHGKDFWRNLWQTIKAGKSWRREIRNQAKDGSYYWVDTVINPIRDMEGKIVRYFSIRYLITEKKEQEAELKRAREAALNSSRAKSDFLSSMSHELRTPMNAIMGFAQLLEMNPENTLSSTDRQNAGEIIHASRHLLDLINEILDLSKIESGNISFSIEDVEIGEIAREISGTLRPLAGKNAVSLQFSAGNKSQPMSLKADRVRLKQVILNLASNAIKYNRPGGFVNIFEEPTNAAGMGRLVVEDNGLGIPKEKQSDLFQPFQRLGAENTDVEGTGIGLVITRKLVELMGGRIGLESEPGKGSRFWIELPRTRSARVPAGENNTGGENTTPGPILKPATILYIEDNPANLRLMSGFLGRFREIKLLTAHTGNLGLEMAAASPVDFFLVDINLPGLNGFELLERLRKMPQYSETPFVAVSANALPHDIERGRRAGFDEYLPKPVDFQDLMTILQKYLAPEN